MREHEDTKVVKKKTRCLEAMLTWQFFAGLVGWLAEKNVTLNHLEVVLWCRWWVVGGCFHWSSTSTSKGIGGVGEI